MRMKTKIISESHIVAKNKVPLTYMKQLKRFLGQDNEL
jgi:hypothetical protein